MAVGVALLLALWRFSNGLRKERRSDMSGLRDELRGEAQEPRGEVGELRKDATRLEINLRERLGSVEGLLLGLRHGLFGPGPADAADTAAGNP